MSLYGAGTCSSNTFSIGVHAKQVAVRNAAGGALVVADVIMQVFKLLYNMWIRWYSRFRVPALCKHQFQTTTTKHHNS